MSSENGYETPNNVINDNNEYCEICHDSNTTSGDKNTDDGYQQLSSTLAHNNEHDYQEIAIT